MTALPKDKMTVDEFLAWSAKTPGLDLDVAGLVNLAPHGGCVELRIVR